MTLSVGDEGEPALAVAPLSPELFARASGAEAVIVPDFASRVSSGEDGGDRAPVVTLGMLRLLLPPFSEFFADVSITLAKLRGRPGGFSFFGAVGFSTPAPLLLAVPFSDGGLLPLADAPAAPSSALFTLFCTMFTPPSLLLLLLFAVSALLLSFAPACSSAAAASALASDVGGGSGEEALRTSFVAAATPGAAVAGEVGFPGAASPGSPRGFAALVLLGRVMLIVMGGLARAPIDGGGGEVDSAPLLLPLLPLITLLLPALPAVPPLGGRPAPLSSDSVSGATARTCDGEDMTCVAVAVH